MSIKSLPWSHGKRWSELHVALILPFFLLNVIYRSVPQILREDGAQFLIVSNIAVTARNFIYHARLQFFTNNILVINILKTEKRRKTVCRISNYFDITWW